MYGVESGELDFFSAITPTPQRKQWLEFTDTYLSFPIVIFTGEDVPYIGSISDIGNKPVAVAQGYASHDLLLENHPSLNLLVVQDVKEGLLRVSTGKAFAFIGSLASASHPSRLAKFACSNIAVPLEVVFSRMVPQDGSGARVWLRMPRG